LKKLPEKRKPGSGRKPIMTVEIYSRMITGEAPGRTCMTFVDWTCPKCRTRNKHQGWFGREPHVCGECGEWTDIKGGTPPGGGWE